MPPRTSSPEPDSPLASVSTLHPEYLDNSAKWSRVRDVLNGSDAVKAGSYLPILEAHKKYRDIAAAYTDRALFVNFASRTVEALTGAIFRKEGGIKVPSRYEPRLSNMNNQGDQLYGFAKKTVQEVISVGRVGLLMDFADMDPARRRPIDFTPYMVHYVAESIINWRTRFVGGSPVLDQVILKEERIIPREFGFTKTPLYRVLELDQNGFLRVRLVENYQGRWMIVDEMYPTDLGKRLLDFIPFVFIGANDLSPHVSRPPILDLVDVNLSHYRTSADLENGRFFTSQPTPIIMGVQEDQQHNYAEMAPGSSSVWLLPPSVTDVRLLEYKGDGLMSLERALDQKERQIAQMGARLLAEPKRTAEAAETVRLRNVAETSTLAAIARTSADGIRTAMEMSCKWAGIDTRERKRGGPGEGLIEYELNQDFVDATMEPGMLAELVRAWQSGAMPLEDFFWNLQRGEMVRPGTTFEGFKDAIDREGPQFARAPLQLLPAPDEEDDPDEMPAKDAKDEGE